jgi:type I restriction enzyme M protein
MIWIAPSEKDTDNAALEKRLWDAADPHDATGRFDFVLANPPFNLNAVDTAMRASARRHSEGTPQDLPARQDHERLKDQVGSNRRFAFGMPRTDNATATRASAKTTLAKPHRRSVGETELHYLWIQLFFSALNEKGRAGFVMANSASDARSSEQDIRRQLIESRTVDVAEKPGSHSLN